MFEIDSPAVEIQSANAPVLDSALNDLSESISYLSNTLDAVLDRTGKIRTSAAQSSILDSQEKAMENSDITENVRTQTKRVQVLSNRVEYLLRTLDI